MRAALRGRYAELGEPTFTKVAATASSGGRARVKLSFARQSRQRAAFSYEFFYDAMSLPSGLLESDLFAELTRQVREVLVENRPFDEEFLDMPVRHHQYAPFDHPRRVRDDAEVKLRVNTRYVFWDRRFDGPNAKKARAMDVPEEEDQEIEKMAVQTKYWSCYATKEDEAAASPK